MSEHKCEGKVWGYTKYLPCGKTARYEHEGRWYCKRHHPPTVEAKLDARNKKWEEDSRSRLQAAKEANEARAEMQRRAAAYDGLIAQRDALLEALRALVRNEGLDAYSHLDKGIGTATAAGQRWLNARAAIAKVEGTTE